jgi:hypothetical protein
MKIRIGKRIRSRSKSTIDDRTGYADVSARAAVASRAREEFLATTGSKMN